MPLIPVLFHQDHCRSVETLDNEDCNCEPFCNEHDLAEIVDGSWLRQACQRPGCFHAGIRYRRGA
jgi:hypothetical protein